MSIAMPISAFATSREFFAANTRASWMLLAWIALLTLGVCMVASSTVAVAPGYLQRHLFSLLLAMIAFGCCLFIPLEWSSRFHRFAFPAAVLVCLLVFIPGMSEATKGAQRWIRIGGFSIQPSELVKPLVVLYIAGYMERFGHLLGDRTFILLKPVLLVGLVCALLIIQPDFGGAVVLATAVWGVLFVGGARLRHFLLLIGVCGALGTVLVLTQAERIRRVTTFLDPWKDAYGDGYQLSQALIAFGRGEITGLGLGESVQKLFYLPEAHNDFIVAVIAEELGVVGVFGLMFLFVVLVTGIWTRAREHLRHERRFIGYLCYGIGLLFALQFMVNVGVCTGVLPTKGLTLPFVSYGGNSLIVCCAMFGLVLRGDIEAAAEPPRRVRTRKIHRG